MKQIVLSLALALTLAACGNSGGGGNNDNQNKTATNEGGHGVEADSVNTLLFSGACGAQAQAEVYPVLGARVELTEVPEGTLEYQSGGMFQSVDFNGSLIQVLVSDSNSYSSYLTKECDSGLGSGRTLDGNGSLPLKIKISGTGDWSVSDQRKMMFSAKDYSVTTSVTKNYSTQEITRSQLTEMKSALAKQSAEMRLYKINQSTYKLVLVVTKKNDQDVTTGLYVIGNYRYSYY